MPVEVLRGAVSLAGCGKEKKSHVGSGIGLREWPNFR